MLVRDGVASVYIGGTLIGGFDVDDDDRGPRNVLAVTLAKSEQFHLGRLAAAFGIGDEYLRRLRRKEEAEGLAAVIGPRQGKVTKITAELRTAWYAMFDAGRMPIDVHREQPRKQRLVYSSVWRVWDDWRRERRGGAQRALALAATNEATPSAIEGQLALSLVESGHEAEVSDDRATTDVGSDEIAPMTAQPVRSGKLVQHVGSWILLALAGEMGLHEEAQRAFEGRHPDGLRIALDAVICALAIGQLVVEGVRRLATPTGATLLRAERVPSASGVRKLLGRLIAQTEGGTVLEARMTERLIATAASDDGPAVFYVDNHLRPYSGKHVVRKGWRMQDKRVLPGVTDHYVHDEDGRPMFRVPTTSHDHLTDWLLPLGRRLREALGDDEQILLAFDRGGAFAEQLAALRDADFDFVTYERTPYPELPATAFTPATIAGDEVALHESRQRNLGKGRGRIRRIVVRVEDGRQISFLAISKLPAERLVEILWQRWRQENGFKHGVERWGINQLDGRHVEPYPPGTIIPNPARRKLERALQLWRAAEGDARRALARLASDSDRRSKVELELAESLEWQRQLERSARCFRPTHPSSRRSWPASSCATPGSSRRSSTSSASSARMPSPSSPRGSRRRCGGRPRPRSSSPTCSPRRARSPSPNTRSTSASPPPPIHRSASPFNISLTTSTSAGWSCRVTISAFRSASNSNFDEISVAKSGAQGATVTPANLASQ